MLDAECEKSLAKISDSGKQAGVSVGEKVAAEMLALRDSDGWDSPNRYRPLTTAGTYVTTNLPIAYNWGGSEALDTLKQLTVPAWPATRVEQPRMGPRLQRNQDRWREEEHVTNSRANYNCPVLGNYRPRLLGPDGAPTSGISRT